MPKASTRIETIKVEGKSGRTTATLRLPASSGLHPGVLLCSGAPVNAPDFYPLLEEVADALTEAGFATLVGASRLSEPKAARITKAEALIDDADALLEWLIARQDVDPKRVCLIAYSTGTLAGAAVAGKAERLNGIGFIAPASPEQLLRWLASSTDAEPNDDEVAASYRPLDIAAGVSAHPIPTLIVQAASEVADGVSAGPTLVEALLDEGITPHSLIVAHADHAFSSVEGRLACLDQVLSFCSGLPPRGVPAATP